MFAEQRLSGGFIDSIRQPLNPLHLRKFLLDFSRDLADSIIAQCITPAGRGTGLQWTILCTFTIQTG